MPRRPQFSEEIEELCDLCTPWCMRIAVSLALPAWIEGGTTTPEEIAEQVGCDAYYLRCVMRHLASKGVFDEGEDGEFDNTPLSLELVNENWRVVLDLDGLGGRMARAWGTLPEAVRAGEPQYAKLFGRTFWEDLEEHRDLRTDFDSLMGPAGHGYPDPEFLPDGEWTDFKTVVDVGGGEGELLVQILRKYRHLRGVLVDLPGAMEGAARKFERVGLTKQVKLAPGSFFNPLPKGGDVYILKSILNDWGDQEAVAILKRCAEAMGPDGRVVVMGGVYIYNQQMGMGPELVLVGGRVRTLEEFEVLAGQAGLKVTDTRGLKGAKLVVECMKLEADKRSVSIQELIDSGM